jgi:Flp pilus assembly protein TadG
MTRAARAWRLWQGDAGAITVEFAIVAPVLIMIFIGMVEFTEAFTINRKLAHSAGAVSDLVAQETAVTSAQLGTIRDIAAEIMRPYQPPTSLVILSVVEGSDETVRVAWSDPASAYAPGTAYTLPQAGLTEPNTGLIVTEATYTFTPTISHFLTGTFTLTERAFFRPRSGGSIPKVD